MRRLCLFLTMSVIAAACGGAWSVDALDAAIDEADIAPPPTAATTPRSSPAGSSSAGDPERGYQPDFEPTDCPMPVDDRVVDRIECGVLVVPVDRAAVDGAQVRVAVAILRSTTDDPEPDPVVYLHGGPGGNALPDYDLWAFPRHDILDDRDLILMDHRGSGYSEPSLNCVEFDDFYVSEVRALERCYERIVDDGVDPSRFATRDIALDVADLRLALGYAEWNVYGISYGTRVALELMRSAPQGVRSVVLDSPYPPEVESYLEQAPNGAKAIATVLEACAVDAECDEAFPDLASRLDRLLEDLRSDPVLVDVEDWTSGETVELYVTDNLFANGLFAVLYDTIAIRDVPLAIHAAAEGDMQFGAELLGVGQGFAKVAGPGWPLMRQSDENEDGAGGDGDYLSLFDAEGAHWSPECAEEAQFSSSRASRRAADLDQPLQRALADDYSFVFAACDAWPVDKAPEATQTPVESDLPTLVVVGEFDPITPPSWADRTIDDLDDARLVLVPAAGHGPTLERCPRRVMIGFLEDPTGPLDRSCLSDLGPRFNLD